MISIVLRSNFFFLYYRTRGRFFNRFRVKPKPFTEQSLDNYFFNRPDKNSFGLVTGSLDNQNYKFSSAQPGLGKLAEEQSVEDQLSVIPEERQYSGALTQSGQEKKYDRYTRESPLQDFGAAGLDDIAQSRESHHKSQLDGKSHNIYSSEEPNTNSSESELIRYHNKNDFDIKMPESSKQNNTRHINSIRQRAYQHQRNVTERTERNVEDEIKKNEAVIQFVQKLEYQKSLEYQMLEKNLKKTTEQKIKQLEEKIEELAMSRDQIKKELEQKAAAPQTLNSNTRKPSFSESPEFTRIPDKNALRRQYFTSGKKAVPPQEISNYPTSGKRNLATQETQGDWNQMNMVSDYSPNNFYHYLQLQQEFTKIREELRENSKRLQEQISEWKVNTFFLLNCILILNEHSLQLESNQMWKNNTHLIPQMGLT